MYTVCKILSRADPYAMGFRKKDKKFGKTIAQEEEVLSLIQQTMSVLSMHLFTWHRTFVQQGP